MVELVVPILVALTVVAQIVILWVFGESILVATGNKPRHSQIMHFLKHKALLGGFIVSLVAMLGSLYYSEILNFEPCVLCWYQRIFMYPQAFLFGIALAKKEAKVWLFATTLSLIGIVISSVHYYEQIAGSSAFCDIVGYGASCSETFSTHLGYITIPLMAASAFLLILSLSFLQRKNLIR